MRTFIFCIFTLVLAGCKSTPTYLYNGNDSSVVTSECNQACSSAIESLFPELSFGLYGAKISPVIIRSVNGVSGRNTYGGIPKYNDDSWGNYELHIKNGVNVLNIEVNNYMAHDKKIQKLELSVNPNGRYFIGQVMEIKGDGRYYKWIPVFYSYQQQKVLIPFGSIEWLGNL